MKQASLPHLVQKKARGRVYWYYERLGERTRLPSPDEPDFLDKYNAAKRGIRPVAINGHRTFQNLIKAYRTGPRWMRLATRTRQDYDKILDWAATTFGDMDPAKMERRHIIRAQSENKQRVRFANYIVQVLSVLFEQAIDMGWITHNPAKGVRLIRPEGDGPHKPWPVDRIDAYTETADHGGPARTVMELCIGTGQRIGDVLIMRWDHLRDGGVEVKQSKTRTKLWIPFTPRLAEYLGALPRRGLTIVTGKDGRPLNYHQAAADIRRVRKAAQCEAYTIHGWRYTAAAELAAAGCTDEEIQAITGHKARAMVVKYAGATRQEQRARIAQSRRAQGRTDGQGP